jgi:cupin superfamily acireductone dioxygenase involved in methionine salvage
MNKEQRNTLNNQSNALTEKQ